MKLSNKLPILMVAVCATAACHGNDGQARPNILFAISDDQSYPHASAYGTRGINTPAFDRLADSGVLFHNAFVPAPQCSPCRAAILTGRNIWQIEEAGTHGSSFPKKYPVFTRALEAAGYHVGATGKLWSPGNYKVEGWERNPVGTAYQKHTLDEVPASGISNIDYAANFRDFLSQKADGQPFFFWYGGKEPHRTYEYGSAAAAGKDLVEAPVPAFLPDHEIIRNDVADYVLEIEWFDTQLGEMLRALEEAGELENTIVIVTADNGMPFPYAKANLQEYGTHVPLVISGPAFFPGGRVTPELVSMIDIAPTILAFTGTPFEGELTGKSLEPFLKHGTPHRSQVLTGRERHTHARPDNLGYPARAIRTKDYLYVWNVKPERWPAGIPAPEGLTDEQVSGSLSPDFTSIGLGYADIDPSPSKTFLLENRDAWPDLFFLGYQKRPGEQLYDVRRDPWCLNNLARNPDYSDILKELRAELEARLLEQGDPRMTSNGDIFESYPRYATMRFYPGFKERGKYNPAYTGNAKETKQ